MDADLQQALDALSRATAADDPTLLGPFLDLAWAIERDARPMSDHDRAVFVAAAAPLVDRGELVLASYVNLLESLMTGPFHDDEWRHAAERRSRIEAVRSLWRGAVHRDWELFLALENVDDMLKQVGEHEGGLAPSGDPAIDPAVALVVVVSGPATRAGGQGVPGR